MTDARLDALDQAIKELEQSLKEATAHAPQGVDLTPAMIQQMQSAIDELKKERDNLAAGLDSPLVPRPDAPDVPFALPESRKAVLLTGCVGETFDQSAFLADMLTSRGYQVDANRRLDLATLRSLPGQNIGVLVITSHAISEWKFSLATQEWPDIKPTDVAKRNEDVAAKRVRHETYDLQGINSSHDVVTTGTVEGYGAGIDFFLKHWKDAQKNALNIFSKNSVVLINACNVTDEVFIKLLQDCGAGTVLAWTDLVAAPLAGATANYIFDRLLGTNRPEPDFFPEKLRQRPFIWGAVLQDRLNHKFHGWTIGGPYESLTGPPGNQAVLKPYCAADCAGPMLVPSITYLHVDESARRLFVTGFLGPDLGRAKCTVSIFDKPDGSSPTNLEVVTWDEKKKTITCVLPSSFPGATAPAPGTAGYVVVTVDGRRSNAIPITEWRGQIVATALGKGSLRETCTLNFSIRMDAHLFRMLFTKPLGGESGTDDPAELLEAYQLSYPTGLEAGNAAVSSTLRWEASGTAHYAPPRSGLIELSRHGTQTIPPASSNASDSIHHHENYFEVTLGIVRHLKESASSAKPFNDTHDMTLNVSVPVSGTKYVITRTETREGNPPSTSESKVPPSWFQLYFGDELVKLLETEFFDLPDPKISKDGRDDFETVTLTLSAETRFPPDLSKGEDYMPALP